MHVDLLVLITPYTEMNGIWGKSDLRENVLQQNVFLIVYTRF